MLKSKSEYLAIFNIFGSAVKEEYWGPLHEVFIFIYERLGNYEKF